MPKLPTGSINKKLKASAAITAAISPVSMVPQRQTKTRVENRSSIVAVVRKCRAAERTAVARTTVEETAMVRIENPSFSLFGQLRTKP